MGSEDLAHILSSVTDPGEMDRLLDEILTAAERKNMELRMELMKDLRDGIPQREIARNRGISLCKITRGSKLLKDSNTVISKLLLSDVSVNRE